MCAIAGVLGSKLPQRVAENMLDTMLRRGPDAQAIYRSDLCTLLHARLAVIDPEGGAQPMKLIFRGKSFILVYNGELYNTPELRSELLSLGHQFSGHSDTEVIVHSYAQWGEACLERFNGIFAFAIWSEADSTLFLARDRIGVKPLFYTQRGNTFLFASEIKTLLRHPQVSADLDESGVAQLLLLGPGRLPGSGVFRNIAELEPGCCGFYQNNKLRIRRYWKLRDREHRENFDDTVHTVRYLVEDAIRRQSVSDVPLGTFLSGGLDSSLISAVCANDAAERNQSLKTFSVDYENNDRYFHANKFQPNSDAHYIGLMTTSLHSDHALTVLTPDDLMHELENATRARDLPGMADVDFSLLAFCREIRKDVTVALSGECADEIFGGYPWYRDPEIREREGFPWAQNTSQRALLMHPRLNAKIHAKEFIFDAYSETIRNSDILPGTSPTETRMKQMVNLNFRYFMQTLLDRKDRMSMFSSLEVRVPFCDYRIAEYLYGVPWEFKDRNGKEKGLLRCAAEGLLPPEVLWRKKSPYPKTFDPRYEQLVRIRLESLIEDKNAPLFALTDRNAVRDLITAQSAWPWYGQLMRRPQTMAYFLQLDFWLREYNVNIVC